MAKRPSKKVVEPEIILPRKADEIEVRVDGGYLRTLAGITRAAVQATAMPEVLKALVYAARSGQLEAELMLPSFSRAVDPRSGAEALCAGLQALGIAARPAVIDVADKWGSMREMLVVQVSWRDAL